MKAAAVSACGFFREVQYTQAGSLVAPLLFNLVATLGNAKKFSSAVAGERQLLYLLTHPCILLIFLGFYLYPRYPWNSYPSPALCTQERVL